MHTHDDRGREIPDPRPVEVPLNMKRPLTIQEEIQRFIRVEASLAAQAAEQETFEEADDFDVGDDPEITSPYELDDSIPEEIARTAGEAVPAQSSGSQPVVLNGSPTADSGKPGLQPGAAEAPATPPVKP